MPSNSILNIKKDGEWVEIPALKGEDGFSPTATVEKVGKVATITITDINGTTTATIADGTGSGGSGEENTIESISVNGTPISIDENKNVDITVPKVTNDLTDELKSSYDDAVTAKHTHDNKTVLDGITSDKVTAWDTVNNKVDKVDGKGLSTEDYTTSEKTIVSKLGESAEGSLTYNGSEIKPSVATTESTGVVKPDGKSMSVDESGTLSINLDGTTITLDEAKNVIKLADALKDKIGSALQPESIVNNQVTTETGFALDARQANPNIDGSLAKQVADLNGSLNNVRLTKVIPNAVTDINSGISTGIDTNYFAITSVVGSGDYYYIPYQFEGYWFVSIRTFPDFDIVASTNVGNVIIYYMKR